MKNEHDIHRILDAYALECAPQRIESLGSAGGFSGARFWRIACGPHLLCLRRWPAEHPDRARLEFIHSVLRHVVDHGFQRVPLPLEAGASDTGDSGLRLQKSMRTECVSFVTTQGHFWELSPWLPGKADFHHRSSPKKLEAAMTALAEFHVAASDFDPPHSESAPSVLRRLAALESWKNGDVDRLVDQLSSETWPELAPLARQIIARFRQGAEPAETLLRNAIGRSVPVQPCIRDIWDSHVLYEGDRVTGLVDFGAMGRDSVATDVARLLGSLARDAPDAWQAGLAHYERIRPLSDVEKQHVVAIDRSTSLLAGMNWLRWIYLERRVFEDRNAVLARMKAIS